MWREKLLIHKANKIQALYPSVKLQIVGLYSLCSIILGTIRLEGYPVFLIPWFCILPILVGMSGIFRAFWKGFIRILFLAGLILLVQSFVVRGEVVLWQFGFIKLYKAGLVKGLTLSFSMLNIAGIFLWMFKTTENREIARALDASGMHYMATYVFMASLRMIQVLSRNTRIIMDAQQARGVETEGNLLIRARAFFPILVPLILGSITGAEERVLTLESKGFDIKGPKTHVFEISRSPYDRAARIIALGITAAVLVWRVAAWVR